MGAGTCIPDPLYPELDRRQLFWADNFPRVSITLQEGDTDSMLRTYRCYHVLDKASKC